MIKKTFKYLAIIGLCTIIYVLCLIFIPRNYDAEYGELYDVPSSWELSTGSEISYTKLTTKVKTYVPNPPIIYLHGGPGGKITKSIIEDLEPLTYEGYDVYFYDQAGTGYSSRFKDIREYTVERHIADLKEIVDKVGMPKVILIGQSWGGILLSRFVTTYSESVHKAILTSPGPIFPIRQELLKMKSPDSLHFTAPQFSNQDGNQKMNNLRTKVTNWYANVFEKKLMPDNEADQFLTVLNGELSKSTVCDASQISPSTLSAGYYSHIMTMKSLYQVEDIREQMKTTNVPVLVMKGQCDNQPWGFTQEYLTLFPNAELSYIEDAGHSIATEQPKEYMKRIKAFLSNY